MEVKHPRSELESTTACRHAPPPKWRIDPSKTLLIFGEFQGRLWRGSANHFQSAQSGSQDPCLSRSDFAGPWHRVAPQLLPPRAPSGSHRDASREHLRALLAARLPVTFCSSRPSGEPHRAIQANSRPEHAFFAVQPPIHGHRLRPFRHFSVPTAARLRQQSVHSCAHNRHETLTSRPHSSPELRQQKHGGLS